MQEYRGFKFKTEGKGWLLVYPSGYKGVVYVEDEAAVKQLIDALIEQYDA